MLNRDKDLYMALRRGNNFSFAVFKEIMNRGDDFDINAIPKCAYIPPFQEALWNDQSQEILEFLEKMGANVNLVPRPRNAKHSVSMDYHLMLGNWERKLAKYKAEKQTEKVES